MANDETIREQALGWAVRTGDPAFADWEAFTLWLEVDPAHARAYDAVAAAVADAAGQIAQVQPANDDPVAPARRPARRALFAGMAAGLALLAGFWAIQGERRDIYVVRTVAGQTRTVTLEADTRVQLAGGTAVAFDRKDARYARLDRGQALFTVRHDIAHPFEVSVDGQRLVDIGTVFDVRHDDGGLSVAVSEGAVQFDPDGADVRVAPGEVLRRPAGEAAYTLSKLPLAQVGEWRNGRLTFQAASLKDVAAQLKRATGINYTARPGGTVSGSILVDPLRRDPDSIGALLGLSVTAQGDRWVIGAH